MSKGKGQERKTRKVTDAGSANRSLHIGGRIGANNLVTLSICPLVKATSEQGGNRVPSRLPTNSAKSKTLNSILAVDVLRQLA